MKEISLSVLEAASLTRSEIDAIEAALGNRRTQQVMDMLRSFKELPSIIEDYRSESKTPYDFQKLLNRYRPTESELQELIRFKDEDSIAGQAIRKLISIAKPDFE